MRPSGLARSLPGGFFAPVAVSREKTRLYLWGSRGRYFGVAPPGGGHAPHRPGARRLGRKKRGAAMTADDSGVVFQGAIRLNGRSITVHGTMRAQGVRKEGTLGFPAGVLPELGRYYRLTLNDGTRLEIVVDDLPGRPGALHRLGRKLRPATGPARPQSVKPS
jgi:hypothetical protein